jgi:hypothetical protein
MFIGAMLIFSGVLIALFPELLSLIVASMLIIVGTSICLANYRMQKMRQNNSPQEPFNSIF